MGLVERAADLVGVVTREPGGPWFIELSGVKPPVLLGPYDNPANARIEAARIREFVAAVEARGAPRPEAV